MIRPLLPEDRAPLVALLRGTERFNDAEIGVAEELMDIVLGRPGQTDYHAFVETVPNGGAPSPAGFVLFGPTPATTGTWHLYWIAVSSDHHGGGIAHRLDDLAATFVKERGGYWLIAETSGCRAYDRARAFYRKRNYSELARIPDYYRPGDDLVVFGKRL